MILNLEAKERGFLQSWVGRRQMWSLMVGGSGDASWAVLPLFDQALALLACTPDSLLVFVPC